MLRVPEEVGVEGVVFPRERGWESEEVIYLTPDSGFPDSTFRLFRLETVGVSRTSPRTPPGLSTLRPRGRLDSLPDRVLR